MPLMLMAKKRRGRDIYQTLAGHTADALAALCRYLCRHRPVLERILTEQGVVFTDFCQLMFLAVFLHDLGKVTREFQERLRLETLDRDVSHTFFALPLVRTGLPARQNTLVQVLALSHHTQPFDRLYYSFHLLPRVHYPVDEIAAFLNTYADVYQQYGRELFVPATRPVSSGLPEKGEREAIRTAVAALQKEVKAWPDTARTKALYALAITILKHCDGEASRAFSAARPPEGTVCGALLDAGAKKDDAFFARIKTEDAACGMLPGAGAETGAALCTPARAENPARGESPAGPPFQHAREVFARNRWNGWSPERQSLCKAASAAVEAARPATGENRPGNRRQSAGRLDEKEARDLPAGTGIDTGTHAGVGAAGHKRIDAVPGQAFDLMRAKQRERLVWICPGQTASTAIHTRLAALCGPENTGLVHALSYFPADPLAMGEPAGRQNGNGNGFAVKYGDRIFTRPVTVATVDHLVFALVHGLRQADYALGNLLTAVVVIDGLPAPGTKAREYTLDALALLQEMGIPCLAALNETPRPVRPDGETGTGDRRQPAANMRGNCSYGDDRIIYPETGTVQTPAAGTRIISAARLVAGRQPTTNLAAVFRQCTLFGYSPLEVRYGPEPLIDLWPPAERLIDVIPAAQWRPDLAGEPEEAAHRQVKIPLTRYLDNPHEFTLVDGPAEKYVIWEKVVTDRHAAGTAPVDNENSSSA